ncbi:MAG TPA: HD domain-containing phosphohydrolase [Candidatus Sulfotelmatobacter sp.]|jgi:HD-GYP domain-containing protein (c-di-GMP phosphodiesterase class II)|nr:HD domain-containing phosphohydrolase [Candidatus Sulfotelmatobacter sp.]
MTAQSISGEHERRYQRLIDLGIALSAERDHNRLMEMILLGAKELTSADGGTLYLCDEAKTELRFEIMRNDSLGIAMGGTTGKPIPFPPVKLYGEDGQPNHKNISAYAAVTGRTVNIPDAYDAGPFDFSGTKAFDAKTGYRSQSFLTVPLKNHDGDVVGVLQLINAGCEAGTVIAFPDEITPLIEALASQAAVALDNQMLLDAQKHLFKSFISVIAGAIDAKSAYTGGHCRRVPELTNMLTRAAVEASDGPFAGFSLSGDEWYELEVAGGLHDCGKVTTPEYVVDKATKLETIYNRIHEIRTRFEVVKRDAEIAYLQGLLSGGDKDALAAERDARLKQLDEDFAFVADCNVGGEFMAPEKVERLKQIARTQWQRTLDDSIGLSWEEAHRKPADKPALPAWESLLADKAEHVIPFEKPPQQPGDNPWGFTVKPPANKFNLGEIYNLSVARGTLTAEDRYHISDHIVQTIIMLEALPFPKTLRRVPEWAGGHHEKMDGTGYPKSLKREQMSIPARIMAIADIFEALTARDRPYKTPKKLSECIKIMSFMKKDQHIDAELFELFLTSGVYKQYADLFLMPEQIDEVDIAAYVGRPAG